MKTRYASKRSRGLVVFLSIALLGALVLTSINEPHWVGVVFVLPIILFVVHLFLNTYYTIESKRLIISCGFFSKTEIDIQSIQRIKPSNDISSAPALSFDRIRIDYGLKQYILISPLHKEAFLEALQLINPNIKR